MWSFHAFSVPVQVQDRQKSSFSIISSLCVKLSYSGVDELNIYNTDMNLVWITSPNSQDGEKKPKTKKGCPFTHIVSCFECPCRKSFYPCPTC